MRQNAMDYQAHDVDQDHKLDFGEFCNLVRDREVGDFTDEMLRERFEAADLAPAMATATGAPTAAAPAATPPIAGLRRLAARRHVALAAHARCLVHLLTRLARLARLGPLQRRLARRVVL